MPSSVFSAAQQGFETALVVTAGQDEEVLPTENFLRVCALTADIYEALFASVLASQLRNDIENSANNVRKSFDRAPEHRGTVGELVEHEIRTLGYDAVRLDRSSGTVALLWAKRSVDFVVMYLDLLSSKPEWTAGECAQHTYDQVLCPYHGWLTGKFVSTVMGFAPGKDEVYGKLGLLVQQGGGGGDAAASAFVQHASRVMRHVQRAMDHNQADFPDKV